MKVIFYPRRFFFLVASLLFALGAVAQQPSTSVTGQVVDGSSGAPLAFMTVGFTGSNVGERTDSLGRFQMNGT